MTPQTQTLCLQYITGEWQKLRPFQKPDKSQIMPPWGVWIRHYHPIPIGWNTLNDQDHKLIKVWLLTEPGLEE